MRSLALTVLLSCAGAAPCLAQSVPVTGMVQHPGPVALDTLKPVSVQGSFNSMKGKQTHAWTGPLLLDVIKVAGVQDEPGKRTHMRHCILVRGADGYAAAIAIGEIEPGGEGKQVIVATQEDGKAMAAPRVVVMGDKSLTRSVHDVVGIEVR